LADDGKSAADLAAENELRREGIALSEKSLKIVKKKLELQEKYAATEAEQLQIREKAENKSIKIRADQAHQDEAHLEVLKKQAVSAISFTKRMELQQHHAEKKLEVQQEFAAIAEKDLANAIRNDKTTAAELLTKQKVAKKTKDAYKQSTKNLAKGAEALGQGKAILKNLGEQVLGQSKVGKGVVSGVKGLHSMVKLARGLTKAYRAGAIAASMLSAALGIGIILLVVGAIAKLVEMTIGLAIKTRDATVAFQRSTGAAKEFGAAIPNLERDMRAVGVSMEEATAAQGALYKSTTDYTMASGKARDDLYKTTALMGEFGVSVETSAKIAQAATKGLGIGIGGADELLLGLSAHAQDIGVPINKMMEDFAASADELKRFGRDGERVFKRLAMVSKVTGMEIGRILSITEKFDTFEGAAKQAGKLNAAIGGNMVNAMDLMMTTDPVERFSMIRDSILDTVGSFDDMSYYQKKFYADAAGLKDVGELATMMSGDFNALDGSIGQNSKSFADQRKKAKELQSTMDLLKNVLASFLPVLNEMQKPLQDMLDKFADGDGPLKELGDSLGGVMTNAIIPFMKRLGEDPSPITKFFDYIGTIPDKIDAIAETFKWVSAIFVGIGVAIAVASLPITGTFAAVTAAIAGLAAGFYWFMEVLGMKNSWSFLDMFEEGKLAKAFKVVAAAIKLFFPGIALLGKMLGTLGHLFSETFDMTGPKETIKGFTSWLPKEWASSVDGIKTEMEISSPSEKMMREVVVPTFVQPMQSVTAKMPGLVDEAYSDVPARVAANLAPLTGTANMDPQLLAMKRTTQNTPPPRSLESAPRQLTGASQAGPQTTQVSIPISIGKDPIVKVVAEIVDGTLAAVSYQGMAGTAVL
jgi:hypothetical protein